MARLATGAIDSPMLGSILNRVRAQAAADPLSNPILLFALDLTLRMDRGEIDIDGLERIVQQLTAEAFADRADRLKNYLGETAVAANDRALRDLIEKKAREGGFEEFRTALARSVFGVVFTAHPTFSISLDLARILAELATGTTVDGVAIDQAGRDERMETVARVEHRPPDQLSLEVEHAWVTEALNHAHDAVERRASNGVAGGARALARTMDEAGAAAGHFGVLGGIRPGRPHRYYVDADYCGAPGRQTRNDRTPPEKS